MSLFSVIALFCLLGLFFVNGYAFALFRARASSLDQPFPPHPQALFWKIFSRLNHSEKKGLFLFYVHTSQLALLCLYFLACGLCIVEHHMFDTAIPDLSLDTIKTVVSVLAILMAAFFFSDWAPRAWSFNSSKTLEKFVTKPAQLFFFLLLPLCTIAYWVVRLFFSPLQILPSFGRMREAPWDSPEKDGDPWTETDKRLVTSVLNFRSRIAREIMKPRVELFCIPETLTLQQAAVMLQKEGYSRVPVYQDTIDSIVGILFYKDVLARYAEVSRTTEGKEALLNAPIKHLIKNVYYCPETKKISSLLQEFRKRKTHLAVVVDEYGGTSGLVTIEDILEEIVGEISDEYDEQENLFERLPGGGWLVDARMNLLDVEEEMGILIPQEEDYDTLAGYIFYRVGSIPQAGLILHHDNFELEITKSNDRMVEEVRITPFPKNGHDSIPDDQI